MRKGDRYRATQRLRRSRTLGWDGNPLRRRVDRLEAVMVAGLIVLFLVGAPTLVMLIGHWVRDAGTAQQRAEAGWRQVTATVQRGPARASDFSAPAGAVEMLARWAAPDGRSRSGWIPVSSGTAAGSSARVWVDRAGTPTGPPISGTQLQGRVAITGLLTTYVLALLLALAGSTGRSMLYRRRLASWEAEWHGVGPRWTRQR
ncbi:MAG: hypothetical protein ACLQK8_22775 [Streptosporangiaceae bacterium]|nr:hypothetical protein [Actinomycetota bacterium]